MKWWGMVVVAAAVMVAVWVFRGGEEAAAPVSTEVQHDAAGYQLRETACDFEVNWRTNVRCAELWTPEYDTPAGTRRFRLPVAILSSDAPERREDPIIYLPGGPGSASELTTDGIEFWQSWQQYTNAKRDLILIDRRGVGRSDPALTCPEYDRYSEEVLSRAVSAEEEGREAGDILRRCFEELTQAGHFQRDQFGTLVSARDLSALMRLLDYREYNLVGVSYGTRLALATAGLPEVREKGWVRTQVLDSVYPPDRGGLIGWPGVVTESVDRFLAWCEGRSGCAESVPELRPLLERALSSLRTEPMRLSVPSWYGSQPWFVTLDDRRLFTAVFSAIYERGRWPAIVEGLQGAVARDPEKLQPLIEPFVNQALGGNFSHLTFMAVDCLDHPLGSEAAYRAQLEQYPQYRGYLERWDSFVCRWLGAADQPLPPLEPLPVPTLLLAGALDPVTPAAWASQLAESWPSAQLYIADDIGHSVLWSDTCAESSLGDFLDKPKAKWRPVCNDGLGVKSRGD